MTPLGLQNVPHEGGKMRSAVPLDPIPQVATALCIQAGVNHPANDLSGLGFSTVNL